MFEAEKCAWGTREDLGLTLVLPRRDLSMVKVL
jgi:hypothetical protein